jgi:DUF218 domain
MTDTTIQKAIRAEFKRWKKPPRITSGDLIWVLSGYETSWDAGSDTRRRLENGIRLAKKLSCDDRAPKVYISGYNEHNTNLRHHLSKRVLERTYGFPKGRLIIGPLENILHTDDQFKKFPKTFLASGGNILIVTDAYHIPRVMRYVDKHFKKDADRFSYYPARPVTMTKKQIDAEIEKILVYSKRNVIPLFLNKKGKLR